MNVAQSPIIKIAQKQQHWFRATLFLRRKKQYVYLKGITHTDIHPAYK